MKVGEKIKRERNRKKINQEEFGVAVFGNTPSIQKKISRIENGLQEPSATELSKIAKFFGLSLSFFTNEHQRNGEVHEKTVTYGSKEGGDGSLMSTETAEKILFEIIKINERLTGLEGRTTELERALKELDLSEEERENEIDAKKSTAY